MSPSPSKSIASLTSLSSLTLSKSLSPSCFPSHSDFHGVVFKSISLRVSLFCLQIRLALSVSTSLLSVQVIFVTFPVFPLRIIVFVQPLLDPSQVLAVPSTLNQFLSQPAHCLRSLGRSVCLLCPSAFTNDFFSFRRKQNTLSCPVNTHSCSRLKRMHKRVSDVGLQ